MANEEQLSILKQGVEKWNAWIEEKRFASLRNWKPDLSGINLSKVDLSNIDLQGANLRGTKLYEVNLSGANLINANLTEARLFGTNLKKAVLSKAHFVEAILRGSIFDGADLIEANLKGADLRGATFIASDLRRSNLEETNLSWVIFSFANLSGANLSAANVRESKMNDTVLSGADLTETDFGSSDLRGAIFNGARIKASSFMDAKLGGTVFVNLDLSQALWLERTIHEVPSTIGIDTISLSKGSLPEKFLQGCGLSDTDIEYTKLYNSELNNDQRSRILYKVYDLQTNQAIQISPLFISYSRGDGMFVDRLEQRLNEIGVRFWRDVHDMKSGRIEKQIDRAMRLNPAVLLILSGLSVKSDWVEHEVRAARVLEKEMGHDVLCPVALDDAWKDSSWPKRILEQVLEYNILDFSGWQDDRKFEDMFRKMIDGLELFYRG